MNFSRLLALAALILATLPNYTFAQAFGGSIAITDHTIFVGEGRNGAFPGTVYLYVDDEKPGTWLETSRLEPADGFQGDQFGRALAADGNMLFAGMPGYEETTGAVVLYAKSDDGSWMESGRLTAGDAIPGDAFGSKIALEGDWLAVAATGRSEGAGGVYIFRKSEDAWQQEAVIHADDAAEGDGFGSAMVFSGESLLVGAPNQNERKGAAYLFAHDAGAWTQSAKLEAETERGRFGEALAFDGTTAYVAAPWVDNRQGKVYTFMMSEDEGWRQAGVLSAFDAHRFARFGSSILLNEGELWIGAPGDARLGSAYLFRRGERGWAGVEKLSGKDLSGRASFASAMSRKGRVAVFGATGVDGGEGAAMIFELQDSGDWMQKSMVISEVKGFEAITGNEVKCENDKAADFDCKGVTIMSFLPVKAIGGKRGVGVNDIWGWTDPQTNKEYALVGRMDGTAFVDVTDPHNPVFIGDLPKTEGSRTSVWRDIKVYKNHAYIVADGAGQHGMQVFDLTRLRNPTDTPITFDADFLYDNIASSHNIVINENTGYAYAVGNSSGGTTCGGGLHMIDIREPKTPKFEGCFADTSTGRNKTGYAHDAQCVIYQGPDVDHQGKELCFGSNETALSIADVTDKENPSAIAMVSYPKVAYTHQGWLTEDHRFFYMNDEGDEPNGSVEGTRTLVWDVTDLDDPILVKEHIASTSSTDHNLYIRGNLMYQSNYDAGFRILDISTPDNPVEVGFLDTVPYASGMGGSWSNYPYFESGTIVVTSMREGLFVVKKEDVAF